MPYYLDHAAVQGFVYNEKGLSEGIVYPVIRAPAHAQAQTAHITLGHVGSLPVVNVNMAINI